MGPPARLAGGLVVARSIVCDRTYRVTEVGEHGFRENSVNEIREVLRLWLGTAALPASGLRKITEPAGVDRKTLRRYVEAAHAAGLGKTDNVAAVKTT